MTNAKFYSQAYNWVEPIMRFKWSIKWKAQILHSRQLLAVVIPTRTAGNIDYDTIG